MPKTHAADFTHLDANDSPYFARVLKECLMRMKELLNDPPYNLILHTAPFRHSRKAMYWKTLEEDYHWYVQLSPRLTRDAGFEWGTGIHINPTPPEDSAHLLRETLVSEAVGA